VVPLTEVALQEMQLNYNAMLEDVYELLDATREQIDAGREYVATLSEFWVASAELTQLLGGKLPATPAAMATAETVPTPSAE
jgi:outer membrane protein, heavy metal efflux system